MSATSIAEVLESKEVQDRVGAELLAQAPATILANPADGTEAQQHIRLFAVQQLQANSNQMAPVYAARTVRVLCSFNENFQSLPPTGLTDPMVAEAVTAFYTDINKLRFATSEFGIGV